MVNNKLIMNLEKKELTEQQDLKMFKNTMATSNHQNLIKVTFKNQNGKNQACPKYQFNNKNHLMMKYQYNNHKNQFTMILASKITRAYGNLQKHAVKLTKAC